MFVDMNPSRLVLTADHLVVGSHSRLDRAHRQTQRELTRNICSSLVLPALQFEVAEVA